MAGLTVLKISVGISYVKFSGQVFLQSHDNSIDTYCGSFIHFLSLQN